jgi:hypothetical protein
VPLAIGVSHLHQYACALVCGMCVCGVLRVSVSVLCTYVCVY